MNLICVPLRTRHFLTALFLHSCPDCREIRRPVKAFSPWNPAAVERRLNALPSALFPNLVECCLFSQAQLQAAVYFPPVWSLSFTVWLQTSHWSLLSLSPSSPCLAELHWQMSRYSKICGVQPTSLWSSFQKGRLSTGLAARLPPRLVCLMERKRLCVTCRNPPATRGGSN